MPVGAESFGNTCGILLAEEQKCLAYGQEWDRAENIVKLRAKSQFAVDTCTHMYRGTPHKYTYGGEKGKEKRAYFSS